MTEKSKKTENQKRKSKKLKDFLNFFQNPIAHFFDLFYNNSTEVVKSGAKCGEVLRMLPKRCFLHRETS